MEFSAVLCSEIIDCSAAIRFAEEKRIKYRNACRCHFPAQFPKNRGSLAGYAGAATINLYSILCVAPDAYFNVAFNVAFNVVGQQRIFAAPFLAS